MKVENITMPQLPWFALHVRSQRECSVADHLSGKGFDLFLPLYKSSKRWSDRVKEVEAPLFPGYLFCRLDPNDRLPVLKTPWVLQIVGLNHTPIPIDDDEINAVRTLVTSGVPTQPWPFVRIGDRVRIESGPLRGVVGILCQFKDNHRLVVSITLLQRSVAVEVDSTSITPEHPKQRNRVSNLIPVSV